MSKRRRKVSDFIKQVRRASREAELADLRAGRKRRAVRLPDKRKQASKRACRDYKGE